MSKYRLGIGPVRDAWRHDRERYTMVPRPHIYNAEFDCFLAQVREEAREEALEEAAVIAEMAYFGGGNIGSTSSWAVKQVAIRIRDAKEWA